MRTVKIKGCDGSRSGIVIQDKQKNKFKKIILALVGYDNQILPLASECELDAKQARRAAKALNQTAKEMENEK